MEAPPNRGIFFQASASGVSEGRGFTSLRIWKGREIWHCGLTDTFYGHEKDRKTFWCSDLFIFKRRCLYSSYIKGSFFHQKWEEKGKGWNSGTPKVKLFLITCQSLLQFRMADITWHLNLLNEWEHNWIKPSRHYLITGTNANVNCIAYFICLLPTIILSWLFQLT